MINDLNEVSEILSSFKEVIDVILEKMEEFDDKIDRLDKALFEEILEPARKALDEADYENRFEDFSSNYGEKLNGYNNSLQAIEGEDFDLTRNTFDNLENMEKKPEDLDGYVNEVVSLVEGQLTKLKEALGVAPDAEVEVTLNEEGVEIEVDGEVITDEKPVIEEELIMKEPVFDDEQAEDEMEEGALEDDPEAIAEFEEELLKELPSK